MESVTILRELYRLRLAVLLVGAISLLIAYSIAFGLSFPPESRSYTVGIANARILVDTPNSQVVEVAPKGSETLGSRANVLANLMVDGEVKDAIAREAGLDPEQLLAGSVSTGGTKAEEPRDDRTAYTLKTGVVLNSDMAELPIISVEAQGPDTRSAIRLADAAVTGLSSYLDERAESQQIENTRRLQVSGLGRAQGHEATRGNGKLAAIGAAFVVFISGCVAVLLISALVRGWRTAAALEREFDTDLNYSGLFDEELNGPNGNGAASLDEGERAGIRT